MIRISDMEKEPRWLRIYHIVTKIVGVILVIFALFVIIANGSMYINGKKNKDKVPHFLGYKEAIINGGSMETTLEIGDMVIAKEMDEYKEQDIVMFKDKSDEIITHRIVEVKENEEGETIYITKGDANEAKDEPMSKEKIEGVMILRLGGLR